MARLVGLIANRPDLINRYAEHEGTALLARRPPSEETEGQWGWGVGFFQGGEILLKRRPLDDRTEINVGEMLSDVRSDLLIAHVRRPTVGALRTANTHPFRYRHWMFADTGTVDGFGDVHGKLHDTLPRFLKRGVRGDTDSELLFFLFLSFLHDTGDLDQPAVSAERAFSALKSSLGLLDRVSREAELNASQLNLLLATPDYLIAAHRGAPMAYRVLAGREDFEPLFGAKGPGNLHMPDLEPCRLAIIASDFVDDVVPPDWTVLPKGAMIAFTRTDDPTIVEA